jgi:hypothetical protein
MDARPGRRAAGGRDRPVEILGRCHAVGQARIVGGTVDDQDDVTAGG